MDGWLDRAKIEAHKMAGRALKHEVQRRPLQHAQDRSAAKKKIMVKNEGG